MTRYVIRRLLWSIPVLIISSILVFVLRRQFLAAPKLEAHGT